jgi:hypothetical protein
MQIGKFEPQIPIFNFLNSLNNLATSENLKIGNNFCLT